MKAFFWAAGILSLCACSSAKISDSRQPSNQPALGEIVTATEAGEICKSVGEGGACLAPWIKAKAYCLGQGSHLPTAREYALFLTKFGIRVLSVEDFNQTPGVVELKPADVAGLPRKDGFYKVSCAPNPDGTDSTFYMNDYNYVRPQGLPGNHGIWTATSPPGHDEAAHVVYDEWGGGGGAPVDHLKKNANAFRCAPGPESSR